MYKYFFQFLPMPVRVPGTRKASVTTMGPACSSQRLQSSRGDARSNRVPPREEKGAVQKQVLPRLWGGSAI